MTVAEGEVVDMNYRADTSFSKRERCLVIGESALNDILQRSKSITTSMTIELDGEFKKSVEKITVDIVDT